MPEKLLLFVAGALITKHGAPFLHLAELGLLLVDKRLLWVTFLKPLVQHGAFLLGSLTKFCHSCLESINHSYRNFEVRFNEGRVNKRHKFTTVALQLLKFFEDELLI